VGGAGPSGAVGFTPQKGSSVLYSIIYRLTGVIPCKLLIISWVGNFYLPEDHTRKSIFSAKKYIRAIYDW
jgi:hypothetical protein